MALMNRFFYNKLLRRYITAFGSLFNNIQVSRVDSQGNEVNRERVPLTFSPKEKYVYKLKQDLDHDQRGAAIKLPRLSFELVSLDYASQRKVAAMRKICLITDRGNQYMFAPTPYTLTFTLSIYTKSLDEMYQVVEQIVPFFGPDYSIAIKPIPEAENIREILPISLQSVTPSDTYEGSFDDRRMIIWTMTFTMPVDFYGPLRGGRAIVQGPPPVGSACATETASGPEEGVIYSTKTSVRDYETDQPYNTAIGTPTQPGATTPQEIDVDQPWDFDMTYFDGNDIVPPYP